MRLGGGYKGFTPLLPYHGTHYLPIGRRDKAEELIHVANSEPVREQLHRRLHLLRSEEVLDSLCHPPATEPGGHKEGGDILGSPRGCSACIQPQTVHKSLFGGCFSFALTCISPGEAAANQDAAQGVLLALHCHGWAHLQIPKGIQAGRTLRCLPGHVTKIRALDRGKKVIKVKWKSL